MLEALLQGQQDVQAIAEFAKSKSQKEDSGIIAALEQHQVSEHRRVIVGFALEHLRFLEDQIVRLVEAIRQN